MMTGGGSNNAATMGLPTMNIPVVATMPMAGMMPIQQGGNHNGVALQQGQTPQTQQQQPNGQNGDKQIGGGGGPEPNAQGVKTFSIKL
jgi:hypothetical protein